jgi:hypothetical protein
VSDPGLHGVLLAECWFEHSRLLNRHVCASRFEALPDGQRAEFVSAVVREVGRLDRRALTQLPAGR